MILRPMTEADIAPMVDLGQRMHDESAFKALDYDKDKCREMGYRYISDPDTRFGAVVEKDGALVAMFMGYLSHYYFGRDKIASDILWYVLPEYRGSLAGVKLLKAFGKWAKERGASEVHIGISTGVESGRTGELLERFGYRHVGGNFKLSVV